MWLISFHGGSSDSSSVNNIRAYHDDGRPHARPDVLPTGPGDPKLRELRDFAIAGDQLYVVNAYKDDSKVLVYERTADSGYRFAKVLVSGKKATSPLPPPPSQLAAITHPYGLAIDSNAVYVSNQDSNVVVGVRLDGTPLPVPPYLASKYPPPAVFLPGTIVASSIGALPEVPKPTPPDVAKPQGLDVAFTTPPPPPPRVANSVRGVLCNSGFLYVADEPEDMVKVYSLATGALYGAIVGSNLAAPVQLLLHHPSGMLYVGSKGTKSIVRYDVSKGPPRGKMPPQRFIDGRVKHASGIAIDASGAFYVAEREERMVKRFPADGSGKGETFIADLPDDPEFLRYVPKSADAVRGTSAPATGRAGA